MTLLALLRLGSTMTEILNEVDDQRLVRKNSFSAFGSREFVDYLNEFSIDHLFLVGVETPICIYLTGNYSSIQRSSNILELPIRNSFNFQDLVRSSDLVVGKVGYGTAVECWAGGTSLLPVYREHFRESAKMRAFVLENLSNREISMNEFLSGNWIGKNLDLSPPLSEISLNNRKNGSLQVANLVISFLHRQSSLPAS